MTDNHHSVVRYRVGGKDYPQVSVRSCKTCQHPMRSWIENMITYGYGWTIISNQIAGVEGEVEMPALLPNNISAHYYNGHMPLPLSIKRKLLEDRAAALGKDIEGAIAPLTDPWSISQIAMQAGFEKLQSGEMEMEMKDLIAWTKLHVEIDDRLDTSTEVTKQNIMALLQSAKKFMTPEQFAAYLDDIENNPALGAVEDSPNALPTTTT